MKLKTSFEYSQIITTGYNNFNFHTTKKSRTSLFRSLSKQMFTHCSVGHLISELFFLSPQVVITKHILCTALYTRRFVKFYLFYDVNKRQIVHNLYV